MMDNDTAHKHIREYLNCNDVNNAISVINGNDIDIDFRDVTHDLQTLLMKLCYTSLDTSSLHAVLEAIFNKDPDVNIQDSWGRTVLMHACISNKPVLIEGLLEYETTNVRVIDFDGNSALSYAVQNCDMYTLEDLLQHPSGATLLTVHNSKGQSPYTIAMKSGDKTVLRLFDSYLDKTISLQSKKKRKPRNRDVTKLPPASYSPSPERRPFTQPQTPRKQETVNYTPRNLYETNTEKKDLNDNKNKSKPKLRLGNDLLDHKFNGCGNNSGKCDSAPVLRSDSDKQLTSGLSLSSPRLDRRHHRQDCLLQETSLQNPNLTLPSMCKLGDYETDSEEDIRFPQHSLRNRRRPSISLPDLRNCIGNLVNSGNSTPNTGSRLDIVNTDCIDTDDDVFTQSLPSSVRSLPTHSLCTKQFTLPEIKTSRNTVSYASPQISRKGYNALERERKRSISLCEDQLRTAMVLLDSA